MDYDYSRERDHYYIAYGHQKSAEYGFQYSANLSSGVETKTIKSLAPNTTYYFQVRGGNGCASGPWSSWLRAKTESIDQTKSIEPASSKPLTEKLTPTEKPETTSTPEPEPTETELTKLPTATEVEPSPMPSPEPEIVQPKGFFQRIINFFNSLFL